MLRPTTVAALIAAAVLVAACKDAVNPPEQGGPSTPLFSYAANGITKNQVNGALGYHGRLIIKGFNNTNPHHGDAVVATFFWLGSTNIIDSVVDVLTTNPYTPVGNHYTLIEYVTAGGYSMATYVATNVQNFPDPNTDPGGGDILAVGAYLSDSITDGGVTISSWTGVEDNFAVALGNHRSSTGTGSGTTTAQAGPIAVDADALVFTVTMSGLFNGAAPDGYTSIGVGSDASIRNDQAYAVQASAGTVNPAWTWFFDNQSRPWLATTFALKRAPPPIALDQSNGTFGESGRVLIKGFNPTNPHLGDAIVASFYWVGSTNIIDSVTDHISSVGYPRVGNTYHLVEYVTAGGISMATYIATNVQNFGDADTAGDKIYVVRANLSDSVTGGIAITAYSGVGPTFATALGAHQSATGSGSGTTVADPGSISIGTTGALAYTTTLSNGLVGLEGPSGFTAFGTGSDASIKSDAAYAVQGGAGSVDPQWTWFFNASPRTWLATVLALKP